MLKLLQKGDYVKYYDVNLKITAVNLFVLSASTYTVSYVLADTFLVFESDLK